MRIRVYWQAGMARWFEILGKIKNVQTIATRKSIRELPRLEKRYGQGRWRKLKGAVRVRFRDGTICMAEVHWYEMTGVGRKELKIKKIASPR